MKSTKITAAMSLFAQCGLDMSRFGNHDGRRNTSATKCGPGRRHQNGDGTRTTEQKRAGIYGRSLRAYFDRKAAERRAAA